MDGDDWLYETERRRDGTSACGSLGRPRTSCCCLRSSDGEKCFLLSERRSPQRPFQCKQTRRRWQIQQVIKYWLHFKKVSFLQALVNGAVTLQISTCSNFATLWKKHQVEHCDLTFKRFNKQAKLDFVDLKNKLSNLCPEGGGSMTWRWCKDWWSIRTYTKTVGGEAWGVPYETFNREHWNVVYECRKSQVMVRLFHSGLLDHLVSKKRENLP